MGAVIRGCGKALPELKVANDDLQTLVDTNDEWISSRTGISERHIAVSESGIALACDASAQALGLPGRRCPSAEVTGWSPEKTDPASIDLVIYATVTPDVVVPSCAAIVKRILGLENAVAFDINAACTGFIYGLTLAESMMTASNAVPGMTARNPIRRALVIGSDRLSRVTDWADRNTCVLFGDGAGAAVLEWDAQRAGILGTFIRNDDDDKNALTCANLVEAPQPFAKGGIDPTASGDDASASEVDGILDIREAVEGGGMRQIIRMDGRTVFKFASNAMSEAVTEVLSRVGLQLEDVDVIVPHQANERIIRFAAKKLGMDMDAFQLSIADTGNTSSASVPMALADAYASGRIKPGDKAVAVAFGGGLTSGAVAFEA